MAEYPVTAATLPTTTCYPQTVQELVNLVADYVDVQVNKNIQPYLIDNQAPDGLNDPWFQVYNSGLPKVVRLYVNGQWKEFSQFSQGDLILIPNNYQVSAPWGNPGSTYTFGDTGIPSYTVATAPVPPDGFKYKVYVGYYS